MTANSVFVKTVVAAMITALLAVTFANTAEARRFGGGKSYGDQGQSLQRSAPNRQQAAPQRQDNTTPAQTRPASAGMGGMLAGLAAGGLLAWLLFGDAFEGLQPMDFLLMILLAVGAFLLFRQLQKRQDSQPAMASLGGDQAHAYQREVTPDFSTRSTAGSVRPGSLMDEFMQAGHSGTDYQPPSWFNEARFLAAARTHFINLQLAWDANRMDEIREFVTAELFRELVRERAALGDSNNQTEVLTLNVELEALGEDGSDLVAAVRFTGQLREETGAEPIELDETWVIRRNLDDTQANWLIAGIRQNN